MSTFGGAACAEDNLQTLAAGYEAPCLNQLLDSCLEKHAKNCVDTRISGVGVPHRVWSVRGRFLTQA